MLAPKLNPPLAGAAAVCVVTPPSENPAPEEGATVPSVSPVGAGCAAAAILMLGFGVLVPKEKPPALAGFCAGVPKLNPAVVPVLLWAGDEKSPVA